MTTFFSDGVTVSMGCLDDVTRCFEPIRFRLDSHIALLYISRPIGSLYRPRSFGFRPWPIFAAVPILSPFAPNCVTFVFCDTAVTQRLLA